MKLALAGDTMLGRRVGERLEVAGPGELFTPGVVEALREADVVVLNLECSISELGRPWPDPLKPFFFRAPPVAAEALALLGVDCVTLANNHALDFGEVALLDTFEHLRRAGIRWTGAGRCLSDARRPAVVTAPDGRRLAIVGLTDHPPEYAAGEHSAGVAYADLRRGVPRWLVDTIREAEADAVLVTPHWGPNMATDPSPSARRAGAALVAAGATLVAGHSAHVFHGVEGAVVYDLGDFIDDYRTDTRLRNDLGILVFVTLDARGPQSLEVLPLKLEYCRTRLATGADAAWVRHRFRIACRSLGTEVEATGGRLRVSRRLVRR